MKNYLEDFMKDNKIMLSQEFTYFLGRAEINCVISAYSKAKNKGAYALYTGSTHHRHIAEDSIVHSLLLGYGRVELKNWKPDEEQVYFYVNPISYSRRIGYARFKGNSSDYAKVFSGNCFISEEEAFKNEEKIMKKLEMY